LISRGEGGNGNLPRKKLVQGVILAIIAMALMAVGIVMIKPLLERSPLLWVTEVRLVGGSVVGGLLLLLLPTRSGIVGSLIKARNWGYILAGSILGANISTVLWLGGMKYCTASISSALNQTSNIFVFIFAALFLKEPVNLRRVLGMALAMTGVFIVTLA